MLRVQQLAQFSVFGLHGLYLFNDFGQIGIGHDVVHDSAHKFGIGHETRFDVLYIQLHLVAGSGSIEAVQGPGFNAVQAILNFIYGLTLLEQQIVHLLHDINGRCGPRQSG